MSRGFTALCFDMHIRIRRRYSAASPKSTRVELDDDVTREPWSKSW